MNNFITFLLRGVIRSLVVDGWMEDSGGVNGSSHRAFFFC